MTFAALQPLADRAALFTALRQDALRTAVDALGPHSWSADVSAGTFVFTSDANASQAVSTRAHLIATLAPGPRSLRWAWDHPQGDAAGAAAPLRDYGAAHGVAELSEPELAFPADADDEWMLRAADTVGGAAVEITGRSPFHVAEVDGGTLAVFLLDAPLPPLSVAAAAAALPALLPSLSLPDARTSVWDLARLASWNLAWADDQFSAAIVTDASGSATFRFDEQARIAGIESAQA